ncbi:hypothetical protein CEXT_120051 [Caerostris extrusa]|uniref:Uncharacterized protein n=1 Tax=Caerostris extrusa TaxID=172846 RepID=A0AAV4RKX2_CAEEX|nr:hypothetical protein CEXT_120051 [Caerostris extrusa]
MAPFRESIRFAAHCNFVQTEDGPMPVEIALATLWERFDDSVDGRRSNKNDNKNRAAASADLYHFPGKYTYKEAIAQVWERYAEKDKGLGWWVAVIGDTQQNFSSIVVYLSWTLIRFGSVPSTKSYPLQIDHF